MPPNSIPPPPTGAAVPPPPSVELSAPPPPEPNNSGQGKDTVIPAEVAYMGWNWGAFFLTWIWGLRNRTKIALLTLIPGPCFVMPFVLGSRGSEWAWQNQRWRDVEHFKLVQRAWAWAGLAVFILAFFGGVAGIEYLMNQAGVSSGPTKAAIVPAGYTIHRMPGGGFTIALPPGWQEEPVSGDPPSVLFAASSTTDKPLLLFLVREQGEHTVNLDRFGQSAFDFLGSDSDHEQLEEHRTELPAGQAEVIA